MTDDTTTAVLAVVVRDDIDVIERCVRSARPLIGAWCIIDNGSTDGSVDMARELLSDLPGKVVQLVEPAPSGKLRSEAFRAASELGDYVLMVEPRWELHLADPSDAPNLLESLEADFHVGFGRSGRTDEQLPLLLAADLAFSYAGAVRDCLVAPAGATPVVLNPATLWIDPHDDERSDRDWLEDARLLRIALGHESDEVMTARYTYFLADCYRRAGQTSRALDTYAKRTTLGGWQEEIYVSHLQQGHLRSALGQPYAAVIDAYLAATDALPTRAEGLHYAARAARLSERWTSSHMFAHAGLSVPPAVSALQHEPFVYEWGLRYEASISAYYVGHMDEGRELTNQLATEALPDAELEAVRRNVEVYRR